MEGINEKGVICYFTMLPAAFIYGLTRPPKVYNVDY